VLSAVVVRLLGGGDRPGQAGDGAHDVRWDISAVSAALKWPPPLIRDGVFGWDTFLDPG
jgi:hypothetical protein